MTESERFWAKVDKTDTCWLWTASQTSTGYGHFGVGGKAGRMVMAHRWAYEALVGPIPRGLQIDHLCRVPLCVNPAHLEPVTQQENTLRGVGATAVNARKTHCVNGHEFNPENTYRWRNRRACRTCRAVADRALKERRKAS